MKEDSSSPEKQNEMLHFTLEWGRLAPIPESKTDFAIRTEGSSFTRAFRSSFFLPKADLEQWIKASPGLLDAEISKVEDGKQKYVIKPGGSAGYAEATLDQATGFVETFVYWS